MKTTWILSFCLVVASCTNSNRGGKITPKEEKIILGFELGMDRQQFFDSLQKRIESGTVSEITYDFDKEKQLRRYRYRLQTVNTIINLEFFTDEDLFYKDKLIEFTCFMDESGPEDSVETAYRDLIDLYMIKYKDFQYSYGFGSEKYAQLGIKYTSKTEQPRFSWFNERMKIEITSSLGAILLENGRKKVYPIKDYPDIVSDEYWRFMTIRYTNENLVRTKEYDEKLQKDKIENEKSQKADSLSKLI
jgi:hypothetical protein